MTESLLVLISMVIGAGGMYIGLRKRRVVCELHGVASYVERQQSEKQSRKKRILEMFQEKEEITNNDIEKALEISDATATRYLVELRNEGAIEQIGARGRFVTYRITRSNYG